MFKLYDDAVPLTARNFRELAIGTEKDGKKLGYKGSSFHRIIPEVCHRISLFPHCAERCSCACSSCFKEATLLDMTEPVVCRYTATASRVGDYSCFTVESTNLTVFIFVTYPALLCRVKTKTLSTFMTSQVCSRWPTRVPTRTDHK